MSTMSAEPFSPQGRAEPSWRRHATFVLVALAYLSVWPYFERLNNPNENVRIWMTRAIVEYHTMSIDRVSAEWGYVNDKAVGRGHIYSSKAPGASFAGVPVLWVQSKLWHARGWPSPTKHATTISLRLFTVMLPSIIFLFFFARWLERRTHSPAARDLLVVGLGAGTMLFPYGTLFVGHAQASLAAFAAFMLLSWKRSGLPRDATGLGVGGADPQDQREPAIRIVAAGALTGAAVLLEYQLLLIAVLLTGYAIWTARRRAVWFVVAAVPFALALGAYHTALFGRPWEFPYGHLENQDYAQIHDVGYHGLAGPRLGVLGTSLFSVSYGLFAYSPFLAVGLILGAYVAFRGRGSVRPEGLLVFAAMLVMTLFISGLSNWRAGWCVGPRYIAGAVPFLVMGVAIAWRLVDDGSKRAEALRALIAGLIASSVFANGISAAVYPHYPEVFDNPIFDLTLPLIRDGYVSYGLGWALGWPRAWSLLPVALFLGSALCLAIVGNAPTRPRALLRLAGAVTVAAMFSTAISRTGRVANPGEVTAAATVRTLWQPQRQTQPHAYSKPRSSPPLRVD
ncbi:MAG: hypothetical protein H7X95_09645 [Deltaproteobacteria bacterium]|nr:hypothetical protein [Deltaproteobacteria bacterium]